MSDYYAYILYGAFAAYALLFIVAAISDVWRFTIPNYISAALVVLFVATAVAVPFATDWLMHFGTMLAIFCLGLGLYSFGVLGAGDAKLLAAGALWVGGDWMLIAQFLGYVGLIGGALAVSLLVVRRLLVGLIYYSPGTGRYLPRLLLGGEGIPYGIAITAGALILGPSLPMFELLDMPW